MKKTSLYLLLICFSINSFAQFGVTIETSAFPTTFLPPPPPHFPVPNFWSHYGNIGNTEHSAVKVSTSQYADAIVSFYNVYGTPVNNVSSSLTWIVVTAPNGQILASERMGIVQFGGTPINFLDDRLFHIKAVKAHPSIPNLILFTGNALNPTDSKEYLVAGVFDLHTFTATTNYLDYPGSEGIVLSLLDHNANEVVVAGQSHSSGGLITALYDFNANQFTAQKHHSDYTFKVSDVCTSFNNAEVVIFSGIKTNSNANKNYCEYNNYPRQRHLELIEYNVASLSFNAVKEYYSPSMTRLGNVSSTITGDHHLFHIEKSTTTNTYIGSTNVFYHPSGPTSVSSQWVPALIEFDDNLNIIDAKSMYLTAADHDIVNPQLINLNNGSFAVGLNSWDNSSSGATALKRGIGAYKIDPTAIFANAPYTKQIDLNNGLYNNDFGNYKRYALSGDGDGLYLSVSTGPAGRIPAQGKDFAHIFGQDLTNTSFACGGPLAVRYRELCFETETKHPLLNASIPEVTNGHIITGTAHTAGIAYHCNTPSQQHFRKKQASVTLKESTLDQINLYPNPVKDILTISSEKALEQGARISVFDLTGRILKQLETTKLTTKIDVSDLSKGSYLLQITEGEETLTKRWVKQ